MRPSPTARSVTGIDRSLVASAHRAPVMSRRCPVRVVSQVAMLRASRGEFD